MVLAVSCRYFPRSIGNISAISCTTKVHIDHKYHYCRSIEVDGDIGHWFTDEYQIKRSKLENINSAVTIMNPTLTKITLSALTQAKGIYF